MSELPSGQRLTVLHVTGDFPDSIEPKKTPVIKSLLELTRETFDHRVVSINRRDAAPTETIKGFLRIGDRSTVVREQVCMNEGIALTYRAPPRGLFHKSKLEELGEWLADHISSLPRRPALIVAHKLTIEGIAVYVAAKALGIPYALSLQGNTDVKILRFRPDLKEHFAKIYHEAAAVFPFAPWAQQQIERVLGKRTSNVWLLPCPTSSDRIIEPKVVGNHLISVFHLRNHRVKNFDRLVQAVRKATKSLPSVKLNVVGGGSHNDVATCEAMLREADPIALIGPRGQGELRPIMNEAIALVMPSRRESFGLVFIEALLSGTPIIYPKGASVDGYFDDVPFAIAVDPKSISEICSAIEMVSQSEQELKSALTKWQKSGGYLPFTRSAIASTFTSGLLVAASDGFATT